MLRNPKKIFIITLFISYFIYPFSVKADTHVYPEDVKEYWVWEKSGSPYILEDFIYIPDDHKLIIQEGVEVKSAVTDGDPFSLTVDGDVDILGTELEPIKFSNLYSLYLSTNTSSIKNALFNGTGLSFIKSTSTIQSVRIENSFNAITAQASRIKISSSTIINNSYGINSAFYERVSPQRSVVLSEVSNEEQNIISINNSTIYGNINYEILNQTENIIDAENNWWGVGTGPTESDINGLVDFDPWRTKDFGVVEEAVVCCSNVLFIPGIEASRLYKDNILTTNTLWEPNRNEDVKKLYMNSDGVSLDKNIYTKDIIGSAFGVKDIYKTFIESMDRLVVKGDIKEWLPLPYDWRRGVYDVVDDALLKKVYSLASTSKTGKISIIAHSNGGLVTKTLMKKLESLGKGNLVENIVFVAVPELGTPQAILSMLHGNSMQLLGGVLLSQSNARIFSQNTPGAYGLLPSKKFFEKNPITVISDFFKTNTTISSFEGMRNFVLNNSFSRKNSSDTRVPLLLSNNLFTKNNIFHSSVDDWKPSSTTKSLSIFGWGLPTSEGIRYKKDIHCVGSENCPVQSSKITTKSGDGTVITKSNSGNSDLSLFFNLEEVKKDKRGNVNHANIFESIDLLSKLIDLLTQKETDVTNSPTYEKYFSTTEPIDSEKTLTIDIYSPVDVDLYDKEGRHTGLIEGSGHYQYEYEDEIPGSYYSVFNDIKTIKFPYDPEIKIVLSGNDTGTFIIETNVSIADNVIASTTFAELPVIASTNMELVIPPSIANFASSTVLNIDIEGDGTIDVIGRTNTFLNSTSTSVIKDLPTYIESVRKIIISLKLPAIEEKRWLNRLDKISSLLEKNKFRKAEKVSKKFSHKKFKIRKLDKNQRETLLTVFDNLLSDIEKYYVPKIDSKGKF